ncbi:MAG: DUF4269 domain-containing protein [Microscillaceae bacterium]|nr:DUF4269 domain-containing protein [Microscillaceae bacterium]
MNFENLDYLQNGTPQQKAVYALLTEHQILIQLQAYDPLLVGTIPLDIATEKSDLDIICCFEEKATFVETLRKNFGKANHFRFVEPFNSASVVVASFFIEGYEVEVYGENTPSREQSGYRHLLVEHKLLTRYGEDFRQQIIALKRQGFKTEPAFAQVLQLEGDPYLALLQFEA